MSFFPFFSHMGLAEQEIMAHMCWSDEALMGSMRLQLGFVGKAQVQDTSACKVKHLLVQASPVRAGRWQGATLSGLGCFPFLQQHVHPETGAFCSSQVNGLKQHRCVAMGMALPLRLSLGEPEEFPALQADPKPDLSGLYFSPVPMVSRHSP